MNPAAGAAEALKKLAFETEPHPAVLAGLVAAALFALFLTWGSYGKIRGGWRVGLFALRALAAAMFFVVFLRPTIESYREIYEEGSVAVLVDDSASMGIRDDARVSRNEKVRAFLKGNESFWEDLSEKYKVDYYLFSEDLRPAALDAVLLEEPEGTRTNLAKTLDMLGEKYKGRYLAGVLAVTDAADHGKWKEFRAESADGKEAAALFSEPDRLGAPLSFVNPAPGKGFRDIQLKDPAYDAIAFRGRPLEVEATVRAEGYDAVDVEVRMTLNGRVLQSRSVRLTAAERERRLVFRHTPGEVGEYIYSLEAAPKEDESIKENNRNSFKITVLRDKLRALFVVGRASWDGRFFRQLLKSDPSIDLITFMILRTGLSATNIPNEQLSLIQFPRDELFVRETLRSFDLVAFDNFNYGGFGNAPYITSKHLKNIRDFVVEDGGAFLMLGGALSFQGGGYAGTPIQEILPVEMGEEAPAASEERFRVKLSEEGRTHPITALSENPDLNEKIWNGLPALEGFNLLDRVKPGAKTLLLHPVKKSRFGDRAIAAVGNAGKGRCMAFASDGSWMWGFNEKAAEGREDHYLKFWHGAINWLTRDPAMAEIKLFQEKEKYAPGEPVVLTVKKYGQKKKDAGDAAREVVSLRVRGASGETIDLAAKEVSPGAYEASFVPEGDGDYQVESVPEGGPDGETARSAFTVSRQGPEFENPSARVDLMGAIAKRTGGTVLSADDSIKMENLPLKENRRMAKKEIARRRIWNETPYFFALPVMLLTVEWFLRRRKGMF